MTRDKKSICERWNDPVFVSSIQHVLLAISHGNTTLNDVDIAGIAIGGPGQVKDLWNANLYRAKLSDVDLSFAKLACSMNEAQLSRVNLSGARMDRCLIRKSVLSACDFTTANVVANLDDTVFESCKFNDTRFSGGKSGAEYGGRRTKFLGCDFSGAEFNCVEFRASQFIDCFFEGAKFVGCDLRGAKATGGVLPATFQFQKMDVPSWASTTT